jgi:hypothetical protein
MVSKHEITKIKDKLNEEYILDSAQNNKHWLPVYTYEVLCKHYITLFREI